MVHFLNLPTADPWKIIGSNPICVRQGGTEDADYISAVHVGQDGGTVLTGYSTGSYGEPNVGEEDFVVIKLDGDGIELWRWQVKASAEIPCLYYVVFSRHLKRIPTHLNVAMFRTPFDLNLG